MKCAAAVFNVKSGQFLRPHSAQAAAKGKLKMFPENKNCPRSKDLQPHEALRAKWEAPGP
jgi:hypothetical protein